MAAKPVWLIVAGDTLLGKEIREVAEELRLPVRIEVAASGEGDRVLTVEDDEAGVMEPLTKETLAGAEVVLLAGDAASQQRALALLASLGGLPVVVDLSGASEDLPNARLRAPLLDGTGTFEKGTVWVVPHAAALVLARCLAALHAASMVRSAVAVVLEPASAEGNRGVNELQQQTISLLSFQSMPKEVYDAQVSFNLLPRFGDDAKASLLRSSEQMERHLVSLLGPRNVPAPSVRVVHAPVFHGYSVQLWVDFESRADARQVEDVLRASGFDVRGASVEPPSNLSVAGQSGVAVGEVAVDRNRPTAVWMWLAADNLRTVADNALLIAGLAVKGQ
ncbi:MAG: hypothetical protein IT161_24880 [Bryobacterales bacterium]|nr:hypothetical protein [Bryobacterales bacterium]